MRLSIRRPILTTVFVTMAVGCADTGPAVEETLVDLGFFTDIYDGAEVCISETCGTLGEVDELLVRPPVVGTRMIVEVSRGEARETVETDWTPDFQALGMDLETARTASVGIGLFARDDGSCGLYATNHEVGGHVISTFGPSGSAMTTACGAFADAD